MDNLQNVTIEICLFPAPDLYLRHLPIRYCLRGKRFRITILKLALHRSLLAEASAKSSLYGARQMIKPYFDTRGTAISLCRRKSSATDLGI